MARAVRSSIGLPSILSRSSPLFVRCESSLRVLARSPCLKLKPVSKGKKSGFVMLNIEPYGGGLWHTWFDRDLSLAGRVLLRAADGSLQHRLVRPQLMTAEGGG